MTSLVYQITERIASVTKLDSEHRLFQELRTIHEWLTCGSYPGELESLRKIRAAYHRSIPLGGNVLVRLIDVREIGRKMEGEFFEEMCAFLDDVLEKEGISKEILMHSRYLFITATSKRAKENMLRCIYALVVVIVGFHAVILASRFA